jgi:excisionase family DNA binding protein
MTTESNTRAYLTTRQACHRLGYTRPDSLLRAWRARGLPLYRRPGGHYLLSREDVGRFVQPAAASGHTGQHG